MKKFSAVKEVKRLSREVLKTPKGRVVPNKKRKTLAKILEKENFFLDIESRTW